MIDEMKKRGIVKIDTNKLTITYIQPTTRETFDSKSFREKNPDLYDEFCKISPVKETVKVVLK